MRPKLLNQFSLKFYGKPFGLFIILASKLLNINIDKGKKAVFNYLLLHKKRRVLETKPLNLRFKTLGFSLLIIILFLFNSTNIHAQTTDSDVDGIADTIDLDDDNDGILDTVEMACNNITNGDFATTANWNFPPVVNAIQLGLHQIWSDTDGSINAANKIISVNTVPFNLISGQKYYFSFDAMNASATTTRAVDFAFVLIDGANNIVQTIETYKTRAAGTGNILVSNTTMANFAKQFNATVTGSYRLAITWDVNEAQPVPADDINLDNVALNYCDTDNDGIANSLDLDSDGDGCSDAFEGGATTIATPNYAFTSAVGTNGLANSLETVADNGTINYTLTYTNATNQSIKNCQDSDGDGVVDSIDIDDDNDGILDTVECPTYCPTSLIANGDFSAGSTGFTTTYTQGNSVNIGNPNTITVCPTVCLVATNGSSNSNGNRLVVNANNNAQTVFWSQTLTVTPNTTYTIKFYAARQNLNSQFDILGNGATLANVNLDNDPAQQWKLYEYTFTTGNITSLILSFRNNIAIFATADWAMDDICLFTAASLIASCDTDGDGIVNSLDLDSDGDGCADAIEGGETFTATNLVASTMPGGNSGTGYTGTSTSAVTQNLGNTVGNTTTTNGVPTIATTGQTIGFSQNGSVNACTDSDNDGVADLDDLDDDNDGILDVSECAALAPYKVYTYNRIDPTIATNVPFTITGQISQTAIVNQTVAGADLTFGGVNWKLIASNVIPDATGKIDVVMKPSATTNGTFVFADAILISNGLGTNFIIDNNTTGYSQVGTWGAQTLAGNFNTTLSFVQPANYPAAQATWTFSNLPSNCDTDGDGIANSLDLDSDGDGCADAIEGGATFIATNLVASTMPGGNSGGTYTGTSTSPVTQNLGNTVGNTATTMGVPTIATTGQTVGSSQNGSINACLDSDNDGVADIDDLDDDNDGILDTAEGLNCVPTILTGEFNGTFGTISSATKYRDLQNPTSGGYSYVVPANITHGEYVVTSKAYGQWFPQFTANLVGHTTGLDDDAYLLVNGSTAVGTFYQETVSVDKNTNYTLNIWARDWTGTGNPTIAMNVYDATGTTLLGQAFISNFNISQGWVNGTAIVNTGTNAQIVVKLQNVSVQSLGNDFAIDDFSVRRTDGSSLTCNNIDTDLDGIPNHLDLDSDGDGCADAIEGGAAFTTTNLATSTMPGGNSGSGYIGTSTTAVTQNLGTAVGSTGIPTIAGTGQSVGYSTNGSVNACTDSDNDGVTNLDDLDDDNDGILDVVECVPTNLVTNGDFSAGLAGWTATGGWVASSGGAINQADNAPAHSLKRTITGLNSTNTNGEIKLSLFVAGGNVANTDAYLNILLGKTTYGQFRIVSGVLSFIGFNGATSDVTPVNVSLNGAGIYNNAVITIPWIGKLDSGDLDFQFTANQSNFSIDNVNIQSNPVCDTDNDGIPNQLDLDSDGDGCPDAIEGGATFTIANLATSTMPGGNSGGSYTGSSSTPVTQNLGNAVSSAAATLGVPTIATTGQTIGTSQNVGVQDPNCPFCPTITNTPAANVNPTSCGTATGSIKICGLIANGTGYTVNYDKNSMPATALTNQTADASGCITITGLTAGSYTNIIITSALCPAGTNALSATLTDPTPPAAPTASVSTQPTCLVKTGTITVTVPANGAGTSYTITGITPVVAAVTNATGLFTNLAAGTYEVIVTVAGCVSQPTTLTVIDAVNCTIPDTNAGLINTPISGNVNTNDTVPPGTTYGTPTAVPGNPSPTLPTVNPDGSYTFTPTVPGVYTFDVPVCPPGQSTGCPTEKLVITVTDPNSTTNVPVANTDIITTPNGALVNIPVKANDGPGNPGGTLGLPTNVTGVEPGATATVKPDGTIDYTPAPGFVGTDTFTYQVCETPGGLCTTATVEVTVLPTGAPNTTAAADDYVSTTGTTPATGNVKTNDKDPEGNTQTVTAQPSTLIAGKGTFVLAADGTYTFTPLAGFSGTVDLPYTTCDNGSPVACADATLHVVVNPGPVTNPDTNAGLINTPISGNVNTNDTVPPGTTYGTPTAAPGNPSPTLPTVNPDGSYTFTPTVPGVYTFDVPVCPAGQSTGCPTEKLVITVTDPNSTTNVPVANTDIITTPNGALVNIPVKANDGPGNPGGTLGLPTNVTGVEPGATATVKPDGTIDYTPAPGFVGTDTFTYQVCETPGGLCTTATVEVTVLAPGAPNTTAAADDYVSTTGTSPATGNVKTNDKDPEGNTQTVTAQPSTLIPGKGTFVLAADGTYTFTPLAGFSGTVDLPYTTCDNGSPAACADATLHVVVNPGPVTNPDTNAGLINTPISGNVNTNDTVPPGTTYGTPTAAPGNPSPTLPSVNPDGSYTFTPTVPGVYTFDVPVCPAGQSTGCPTEKLVITVTDPASTTNPPVANTDITTTPNGALVNIPVKANDGPGNPGGTLGLPTNVTGVESGATATVKPDGTIDYTPAPGFVGTDTFTYQVCETPGGLCTTATVEVTVLAPGAPNTTAAADDYVSTTGTSPATGNVKTNDKDPEGNTQTVTAQPSTLIAGKGTFVLAADGTYTFTPLAGFSGTVDLPYTTCDNGSPAACADATLHVVVKPAPITNPDTNAGLINTPITGNVNTNDTVPPGTTYGTPTAAPGNPSPTLPTVNPDGSYTFTPTLPGVYTFDVPVCPPGQSTGCPTEKLVITVTDPTSTTNLPVANTDIITTPNGALVNIPVKANDGPGNPGGTLGLPTNVTGVEPGATATVLPNGTIDYTPAPGFVGTDTFTYQVCETPGGLCTTATVEVTVLPTGAPNTTAAADDYVSTTGTTPATGNVKTNDKDPEGNTQTVTAQPSTLIAGKGTFVLAADGTYTFTPLAGFSGTVDLPYTTCDNGSPAACADASLHIVVKPEVCKVEIGGIVYVDTDGLPNINGTPLDGIMFDIYMTLWRGTTKVGVVKVDATGNYKFVDVDPGTYRIVIGKDVAGSSLVSDNKIPVQSIAVSSFAIVGEGGSVNSSVSVGDGTPNGSTTIEVGCKYTTYEGTTTPVVTTTNSYLENDFGITDIKALPVDLLSFNAKQIEENIILNWKTANEKEFSHFEIQKSLDAKEFGSIGNVKGNQSANYNFVDVNPAEGNNYYRLKMVDLDGTSKLSKVIIVNFEKGADYFLVENPANNGEFKVMTNLKNPKFTLLSSLGQVVEMSISEGGSSSFVIKTNSPAGVYYLNIESNGKFLTRKILKP